MLLLLVPTITVNVCVGNVSSHCEDWTGVEPPMFRTHVAILFHFHWQKWPQMVILVTQVNLGSKKMVPMEFPCPKTWG